ncbi:unnamed protein product, partial [Brassica rapa subsp. narinosa]
HHIFTANNEEDEHGDMKPASIAEVFVCLSMVIIVTSSLIRDMNSKIGMYRANGITI